MKRQRDTDDRAERVRMMAEALRARGIHSVIPAAVFGAFVKENAAKTRLRPNPAVDRVVRNPTGFSDFIARMQAADAHEAVQKARRDGWPTLTDLAHAADAALTYIAFDEILERLRANARALVAAVDDDAVVWLIIPQFDKSSMWLSAYLWLAVPELASCVDFVGSDAWTLEEVDGLGEQRHRLVLVDDVSYSGAQIDTTFTQILTYANGDLLSRTTVTPLVACCTPYARARLTKSDNGAAVEWLPATRELATRLVDFLTPAEAAAFERDGSAAFWYAVDDVAVPAILYEQFFRNGDKPLVVCEHKLPDSLSTNTSLLDAPLYWDAAKGKARPGPPLVTVGGRRIDDVHTGSSAFYKPLRWTYKKRVQSQQQFPLEAVFIAYAASAAAPVCAVCAQPAQFACAQCNLAFYCAPDGACQRTHWLQQAHARACALAGKNMQLLRPPPPLPTPAFYAALDAQGVDAAMLHEPQYEPDVFWPRWGALLQQLARQPLTAFDVQRIDADLAENAAAHPRDANDGAFLYDQEPGETGVEQLWRYLPYEARMYYTA